MTRDRELRSEAIFGALSLVLKIPRRDTRARTRRSDRSADNTARHMRSVAQAAKIEVWIQSALIPDRVWICGPFGCVICVAHRRPQAVTRVNTLHIFRRFLQTHRCLFELLTPAPHAWPSPSRYERHPCQSFFVPFVAKHLYRVDPHLSSVSALRPYLANLAYGLSLLRYVFACGVLAACAPAPLEPLFQLVICVDRRPRLIPPQSVSGPGACRMHCVLCVLLSVGVVLPADVVCACPNIMC